MAGGHRRRRESELVDCTGPEAVAGGYRQLHESGLDGGGDADARARAHTGTLWAHSQRALSDSTWTQARVRACRASHSQLLRVL